MCIVLELRDRQSHSGVRLVHPDSEHVVLGNVFGVIKNLPPNAALNPWLSRTMSGATLAPLSWRFDFWQKQSRPRGLIEGSTEVDLVLESMAALVFIEVKMGAAPSAGTKSDPERHQLVRNLDVGYARAVREETQFALVYITPDECIPEIVSRIKEQPPAFPGSPDVDPRQIGSCLHWSSWAAIADSVASAYEDGTLSDVAQNFALDLLAYVAKKGLWRNTLPDLQLVYENKLYRALQRDGSPFVPFGQRKRELYQDWRLKPWNEERLRR
jgi:hypothetical protein